jgi:hypothetical protein
MKKKTLPERILSESRLYTLYESEMSDVDTEDTEVVPKSHTHIIEPARLRDFIMGGKAIFTVKSGKTGKHFTFKVIPPKKEDKDKSPVYFVKVLTGSDNTSNYTYIGHIWRDSFTFVHGKKSRIGADAPSVVAFSWLMRKVKSEDVPMLSKVEVWHEGRCCRCGRLLTDPLSIELGIGPECRKTKHLKGVYVSEKRTFNFLQFLRLWK